MRKDGFHVLNYFNLGEVGLNVALNAAPPRKAIFSIYFAQAVKGILIDHSEDEVILKHGSRFKVMVKKDNVKKYDLYLVQACSAACEASVRPDVAAFWSGLNVQD